MINGPGFTLRFKDPYVIIDCEMYPCAGSEARCPGGMKGDPSMKNPALRGWGLLLCFSLLLSLPLRAGAAIDPALAQTYKKLAASIDPAPSTAIVVAVASSLGMPFVVSTPPNAMAVTGGLRAADLLWPGLALMLGGCALVAVSDEGGQFL